jgi:hypothetical protein
MANLDSRVSALERSLGEPEPVEINVNIVCRDGDTKRIVRTIKISEDGTKAEKPDSNYFI